MHQQTEKPIRTKFIQISAATDGLYALDEKGYVWIYSLGNVNVGPHWKPTSESRARCTPKGQYAID